MREEDLVDNWCFEIGLENEGWLNKGEFGTAYTISDDKVIKITDDYNEFIQTFGTLNNNNHNLTEVYGMRVFPDGRMGILMENLVTDGVEDLFSSLLLEAEIQNVDFIDIETEDTFLPDELIKFSNDLNASVTALQKAGVAYFDIHDGNIGLNREGNYVLFDQTNKLTKEYNEDLLEDIKEKLLSQYDLEETIYKENIPLSKIVASSDSMIRALRDVSNNRISQTEGAIECMYNYNGDLQITDGYHRLCEALLSGDEFIDVEIGLDERYGYSHPVYAVVERDDALDINTSFAFGGLEDIADTETLGDYFNNYTSHKKSLEKGLSSKRKIKPNN